jgi:hypothetical protein
MIHSRNDTAGGDRKWRKIRAAARQRNADTRKAIELMCTHFLKPPSDLPVLFLRNPKILERGKI